MHQPLEGIAGLKKDGLTSLDIDILQRLGGACDHPMTVNFPEGEYLKGLVIMKSS